MYRSRPRRFWIALTAALALAALTTPIAAGAQRSAGRADLQGSVYFFLADNGSENAPGPSLVPAARNLDRALPATTAMAFLLDGPRPAEAAGVPGMSSEIPDGTTMNAIGIAAGVATIDLSSEFVSGGGSASMMGRLAQVVFTLTQFPTVGGVRFEVDGVPTTVFGGEGVIVNDPATRADFHDVLPAVFLDKPPAGGYPSNPARLTGLANTFEANLQITITDAHGLILTETFTTASAGNGVFGDFDTLVAYDIDRPQRGTIIVWEGSALDGSPTNIREHPVWLVPETVLCRGVPADIVGTMGPDRLIGTAASEVIHGMGGDDEIRGRGGDDRICAGPGNDLVSGGPGDDIVFGQTGDDRLIGGSGRDILRGGAGDDFTAGQKGPDLLFGGPGLDIAAGGPGRDRCDAEIERGC